ncbi:MAG: pentapeptide repeat-containing protein [Opitutae bacterium]
MMWAKLNWSVDVCSFSPVDLDEAIDPIAMKKYKPCTEIKSRNTGEILFTLKHKCVRDLDFIGMSLINCDFNGMDLSHVVFDCANLMDSTFKGSKLKGAQFEDANLRGTTFENAYAIEANFSKADMFGSNLTNANFSQSILDDAVLEYSICCNTIFRGSRLHYAKVQAAILDGADFRFTDLSNIAPLDFHQMKIFETAITEKTL